MEPENLLIYRIVIYLLILSMCPLLLHAQEEQAEESPATEGMKPIKSSTASPSQDPDQRVRRCAHALPL